MPQGNVELTRQRRWQHGDMQVVASTTCFCHSMHALRSHLLRSTPAAPMPC